MRSHEEIQKKLLYVSSLKHYPTGLDNERVSKTDDAHKEDRKTTIHSSYHVTTISK